MRDNCHTGMFLSGCNWFIKKMTKFGMIKHRNITTVSNLTMEGLTPHEPLPDVITVHSIIVYWMRENIIVPHWHVSKWV